MCTFNTNKFTKLTSPETAQSSLPHRNMINIIHHLLWIFRPILFLFRSNETTLTDTLSPRLTLPFLILEVWISPFCPTPISTNAPKWVTLVIFPVNTVPILRELTSWTSFLNNGFSKSGRKMHTFNIKYIAHLQIVF